MEAFDFTEFGTTEPCSDRPFGFLETRAKKDIEAAFGFWESYESSKRDNHHFLAASVLPIIEFEIPRLLKCLDSHNAQLRVACVIVLRDRWIDSDDAITKLMGLGFDDPDPTVRGLAWWCLGDVYRLRGVLKPLYDSVSAVFRDRFQLVETAAWRTVIIDWVKAINDYCRNCEVMHQRRKTQDELTAQLAGDSLEPMLQNCGFAESLLYSPEPTLRSSAIRVLSDRWPLTPSLIDKCEEIMLNDTDLGTRISALGIFVRYYRHQHNARAENVLAKIVLDESKQMELRDIAYQSLFQIRGEPVTTWPEVRRAMGRFSFPDDVDWGFVKSCATRFK